VIPLRDENPSGRFAWVTMALIAANVAVFIAESRMGDARLATFLSDWAYVPTHFLEDPLAPHGLLTVFASMFLHASPIHVGSNMLYLWIFGNNVENRFGSLRFLGFYLACGIVATAVQTAASPALAIPLIGASGAVAGVLGAYVLLFPRASVLTIIPIFFIIEVARVPAFLVIGFWFLLQLANGVASLDPTMMSGADVAWFAHLGGFAAGLVITAPVLIAGKIRETHRKSWR